jgi:hypothetical protein
MIKQIHPVIPLWVWNGPHNGNSNRLGQKLQQDPPDIAQTDLL